MTLLSILGFQPQKRGEIRTPLSIDFSDISIIIPVRNNQKGIDLFLSEFVKTHTPDRYPKEIIIVDNNSQPSINIPQCYDDSELHIVLLNCVSIGPACARNCGAQHAQGNWILFTDSDCIPSQSFMQGYFSAMNGSVGYAGYVKAWGNDFISQYYESQQILIPFIMAENGNTRPEYLVTANALVWKQAFADIGGFNETIVIAAGEDIDLGFRLREIGTLSMALSACVFHNFDGGLPGFCKRFVRYGRGNKMVGELHHIDLTPTSFNARKPSLPNNVLARIQFVCLYWGYIMQRSGTGARPVVPEEPHIRR